VPLKIAEKVISLNFPNQKRV